MTSSDHSLTIAGAALNQTPLDWNGNRARILEAIRLAKSQAVHILCLPELCVTGYGCEDMFLSSYVHERALNMLDQIAKASSGIALCVGLPIVFNNALFNCAAFLCDGNILGFVAKQNLAGDGVYYEPRWFKPWPKDLKSQIEIGSKSYPIGDIYFNVGGVKIGFEICEDAWAARRTGAELSDKGIDLILNPSASHFAFGKEEVRERFVLEGSRAYSVSYVYTNLLGCESGRIIYDGGILIASAGKLAAQAERFSFKEVVLCSASVDLSVTRMSQAKLSSFKPKLGAQSQNEVKLEYKFKSTTAKKKSELLQVPWERSEALKAEEFTRAISLGLFDYLRKTSACGFVVSLSGGVDSSAVSCLVAAMLKLSLKELGWEAFKARLPKLNLQAELAEQELCAKILTTVYQATSNSSQTTLKAAKELSKALGATFLELKIEPMVQGYLKLIVDALGRKISWESDDIALQNIQARTRGPSVWLVANLKNALLLSTSNRSEAAVGYATMDGDTCGGLSPISGIDKAYLKEWLVWMEKKGPEGLGPIAELSLVNAQEPTAELRPLERCQTDEQDLMPYELLDQIERLAIRDKKGPLEVYQILGVELGGKWSADKLARWVEKFYRLWAGNQWKRERYAPGFHLDDENLDPKTWCRFPILSGNFEAELEELRRLNA